MTDYLDDDDDGDGVESGSDTSRSASAAVATQSFDHPVLSPEALDDSELTRPRRRAIVGGALGLLLLLGTGAAYASRRSSEPRPRTIERREAKVYKTPDSLLGLGSADAHDEPSHSADNEDRLPEDRALPADVYHAAAQPRPVGEVEDPCPEDATPAQCVALEEARMKAAGDPAGRGKTYMGGTSTYAASTSSHGAQSGGGAARSDYEDEGDYTLGPIVTKVVNERGAAEQMPQPVASEPQLAPMMMPSGAGQVALPAGLKEALEKSQGGERSPDDVKEAFAATVAPLDSGNVERELAECELTAGRVIHVANLTAINTDVPARATITAQVVETVYCGADRQHVAIPAGSTFTASANARVAYGDNRIQVVMDQLVLPPSAAFPRGSVIATDGWAAADITGMIGWTGVVDNHWSQLIGGVALSTLFSLGATSAAGSQEGYAPNIAQRAASQAGGQINQAGQRITQRELQRKPTIERQMLESGTVIVTKNQPLRPYRARGAKQKRRGW